MTIFLTSLKKRGLKKSIILSQLFMRITNNVLARTRKQITTTTKTLELFINAYHLGMSIEGITTIRGR
ncbi:hypothetical protein MHLP_02805 [Candidatus Mycoplasma haematolamae str. Purdue]|uniref:Uncharacterized protein n=1 Tax=Mycoplasma haematolamae (strain Purdue) TaxID=1212765 RepID=I7CFY7_MYCHA|nr:hypothetical protein MHLP_02805 [Candidatus Mycoplasma haematolamae str. Purdue]